MQKQHSNKMLTNWLWHGYLKRHLPVIVVAFLLMAVQGGMLGGFSLMVGAMFDRVLIGGNRDAVLWVALIVLGLFIFRALSGFGQRILMASVGMKVSAQLQREIVGHMLTLDSEFFQRNSPGTLIERVRGDTQAASAVWSSTFSVLGRDLISLISLFAVALSIDWLWTLIAIAGAPLLVLPMSILQRFVRAKSRDARSAAARISTRLDEVFHGINTIKLNSTERRETARFGNEVKSFVRAEMRSISATAGAPALIDLISGIGFFGVFYYGGLQIMDGDKTVGQFMTFFTAMALVFDPLRRLGGIVGTWQIALSSIERLYSVFQERPKITSPANPVAMIPDPGRADVVLKDVDFSYGDKAVLCGTSFVAKAGKTTALVGASGAGKSTIFNILTRLVDAENGQVTIGNSDITGFDLRDLRGLFSVVTQDTQLFDETVRDNVLLGQDMSDEQLSEVLQAAHVTDFLPQLASGIDTEAGPRGSGLSGGQRQRVAIARALFRDTPILLLDEATSALDAKSEAVVQAALERLSKGRTTLVIAHRLATIRNADNIIVMDHGRVVDQGTHQELIARGGLYADLCRLQFSEET